MHAQQGKDPSPPVGEAGPPGTTGAGRQAGSRSFEYFLLCVLTGTQARKRAYTLMALAIARGGSRKNTYGVARGGQEFLKGGNIWQS